MVLFDGPMKSEWETAKIVCPKCGFTWTGIRKKGGKYAVRCVMRNCDGKGEIQE